MYAFKRLGFLDLNPMANQKNITNWVRQICPLEHLGDSHVDKSLAIWSSVRAIFPTVLWLTASVLTAIMPLWNVCTRRLTFWQRIRHPRMHSRQPHPWTPFLRSWPIACSTFQASGTWWPCITLLRWKIQRRAVWYVVWTNCKASTYLMFRCMRDRNRSRQA